MGLVDSRRVQRLYERVIGSRNNCSFEDLEKLLVALGFIERKTSGSHVFFKRGSLAISIPKRRPVKKTYVEQVLELVDRLRDEP